MTYALQLSDAERDRYRLMAAQARTAESTDWIAAGITIGARIADIGCGPGALLRLLADIVGPDGIADGVDQDPDAVTAAHHEIRGLDQASARIGSATDSGLPSGTYDVVMCRHVLAHNGSTETAILAHLTDLARPGGTVYLVDADLPATRIHPLDPDLTDLADRYIEYHRAQGNNVTVGITLGSLLEHAGLTVHTFRSVSTPFRLPPELRPPAWATRHALLVAGDSGVQA